MAAARSFVGIEKIRHRDPVEHGARVLQQRMHAARSFVIASEAKQSSAASPFWIASSLRSWQ
jgi:hypothetical protein